LPEVALHTTSAAALHRPLAGTTATMLRCNCAGVGVEAIDDVVDEAVGRRHRPGPVVGRTAGPAGNAQLTAQIGLHLLARLVPYGH
jgi:hypothetical protein